MGDAAKFASPFDANLLEARKRSQRERLWDIFASYALQLSCEDPMRMRTANVVRLLQDCGVIDGSESDEAKMVEKEVSIICESFLKSHPSDRDAGGKKLDFPAFLALLMNFAKMAGDQDAGRAYDSLVRTCLEKQKKRRPRVSVAKDLQACKQLLAYFDDPLSKIFAFYAAKTHGKLEKSDPKAAASCPAHMGYGECVAWGRKYGIISHGVLTTTEFATIYIDSLPKSPSTEYNRVLTYESFCEMAVRLAKKAGHDRAPTAGTDHHLKALFQLMWLSSASNSPRSLQISEFLKSDRLDVTRHFRGHFEKFWKKERFQNFLDGSSAPVAPAAMAKGDTGIFPPASASTQHRRLSLCVRTKPDTLTDQGGRKKLERRHSTQPTESPEPRVLESTKPALKRAVSLSAPAAEEGTAVTLSTTASIGLTEPSS